jgi:hypothetical protein
MTPDQNTLKTHHQSEEIWLKHCNPLCVWTRYIALAASIIIFWSRKWIGWWCVPPGIFSLLWMFFNPLLFRKPHSTKNWASKTVLGERVFLNRDKITIPEKHNIPLHAILTIISSTGIILVIWSVVYYSFWGVILGVVLAYLGKSWFLDRMVWLYEDMKNENEIYKSWDY